MTKFLERLRPSAGLLTLLTITAILSSSFLHTAYADEQPPQVVAPDDTLAAGTLHNGGFDNTIWYEFNDRYGAWLAESWVPDGNFYQDPQDWRLWYMRGTGIIWSFSESSVIQGGIESVGMRTYDSDAILYGGLYQVIANVVPCMTYRFQIYGRSQPPSTAPTAPLRAGIDVVGWHPPTESGDPAVPNAFPSTTVWGAQQYYYYTFGPLSVEAEARASQITVFSNAYATGGHTHGIVWDTALLQELTTQLVTDPGNPPDPSGISNLAATPSGTSATVTWDTTTGAMGQVYYRLVATPFVTSTASYSYTTYLPMIARSTTAAEWRVSPLAATNTTAHSITLTGLTAGARYEYYVASRGLSNGTCTTWVSTEQQFTLP